MNPQIQHLGIIRLPEADGIQNACHTLVHGMVRRMGHNVKAGLCDGMPQRVRASEHGVGAHLAVIPDENRLLIEDGHIR